MKTPAATLEIQTLGRFNITVAGNSVAANWPDKQVKVLFCSLFSPLNLYFSWDRISRSILAVPASVDSRRRLEEEMIGPLNSFLIGELGFSPLVTGDEGIRIDFQRIDLDAFRFHRFAVEGRKLLSAGNHGAAFEKFSRAKSLYLGSYLPGIPGRIIANTRDGLDCLYQSAVMDGMQLTRKTLASGRRRMADHGPQLLAARKPLQKLKYGHQESL